MSNKKGLEVAVGTIVLIILAILVFIFAIAIIFDIFGGAEEIKAQIDIKTKSQIEAAMQRTNELVSIPFNVKPTKTGDVASFGMGVKNILTPRDFSASVSFDNAYFPDGKIIPNVLTSTIMEKWLGNFKNIPAFHLGKNDYKLIPITILAYADTGIGPTQKGDYVFNVCIFSEADSEPCDIATLSDVYTGRKYQVVVRVV